MSVRSYIGLCIYVFIYNHIIVCICICIYASIRVRTCIWRWPTPWLLLVMIRAPTVEDPGQKMLCFLIPYGCSRTKNTRIATETAEDWIKEALPAPTYPAEPSLTSETPPNKLNLSKKVRLVAPMLQLKIIDTQEFKAKQPARRQ